MVHSDHPSFAPCVPAAPVMRGGYNPRTMMQIAFVAHTRLRPDSPHACEQLERVAERVAHLDPALTIHLGEITADGAGQPVNLYLAAERFGDWPTPMRLLAGERDIGTGSGRAPLDTGALLRFRRTVGADYWAYARDGWMLVGLNARLFGTATDAEADQWQWIEGLAPRRDTRIVLCMNTLPGDTAAHGMRVPGHGQTPAAERLLRSAIGRHLRAVCTAAPAGPGTDSSSRLGLWHLPGLPNGLPHFSVGPVDDGLGWMTLLEDVAEPGVVELPRRWARDPDDQPLQLPG